MSKVYEFKCWRHGKVRIEVERPPLMHLVRLKCPFCERGKSVLVKPVREAVEKRT